MCLNLIRVFTWKDFHTEGPLGVSVLRRVSRQPFANGTPVDTLAFNQSRHSNQERLDLKERDGEEAEKKHSWCVTSFPPDVP